MVPRLLQVFPDQCVRTPTGLRDYKLYIKLVTVQCINKKARLEVNNNQNYRYTETINKNGASNKKWKRKGMNDLRTRPRGWGWLLLIK